MEIVKLVESKKTIVAITGAIDTTTSPTLEAELKKINADNLVLDFMGVSYVSSAGLRLLITLTREYAGKENGSLEIINVKDEIKEVISMTGFLEYIPIK